MSRKTVILESNTEEKLKKALKAASKVIKTRIFEEENRPIFEEAFPSVQLTGFP